MKYYIDHTDFTTFELSKIEEFSKARKTPVKHLNKEFDTSINKEEIIFFGKKSLLTNKALTNKNNYYFIIFEENSNSRKNIFFANIDQLSDINSMVSILETNELSLGLIDVTTKSYKEIVKSCAEFIEETILKLEERSFSEQELKQFFDMYIKLLLVHKDIYSCITILDMEKKVTEGVKALKTIKKIKVISDLIEFKKSKNDIFIPLFVLNSNKYLKITFSTNDLSKQDSFIINYLHVAINSRLVGLEDEEGSDNREILFLEKILNMLSMPVALFAESEEMVLRNSLFLKLNIVPNQCLKFNNNQIVELSNLTYRVHKAKIERNGEKLTYFVFMTDTFSNDRPKADVGELGIISSSIAHELNNPLAGMLGAISLMQLEDNLDAEIKNSLSEMKETIRRCKELIGIFLGFSKMRPVHDKEGTIKSAFSQALNLLRFRMVESNLRFDIEVVARDDEFKEKVNLSIVSMIFYLTLSEIMTLVSHKKLLKDEKSRVGDFIKGEMIEKTGAIEITFEDKIDNLNSLKNLKLLNYLITYSNLTIEFDERKIVFNSI